MTSLRRLAPALAATCIAAGGAWPGAALATPHHTGIHVSTGHPAMRWVRTGLHPANEGTEPPDPASNTQVSQAFLIACNQQPIDAAKCDSAGLADFARGRQADGLGPMTLPSGFDNISPATQLFVLANIDRVDHGLPPVLGRNSALDGYAKSGADAGGDPAFPSWATEGGSNWAGATSPLLSEFLWVYDDGLGSSNVDCTQNDQAGCWGHRHDIMFPYDAPRLMGAAETTSDAELFLGQDNHDTADVEQWSDYTGRFPVGLSATRLRINSTGAAGSGSVTAWASGEAMNVTASITQGSPNWSLDPYSCDLLPGTTCQLTVRYAPPATGPAVPGTLSVTGPNGTRQVTLTATPPDASSVGIAAPSSLRGAKTGTVTGTLTDTTSNKPLAGAKVTLESRPLSSQTWTTAGQAFTGSDGTASFSIHPSVTSAYRVSYAGTDSHQPATSPSRTVSVKPIATLKLSAGHQARHKVTLQLQPGRAATYVIQIRRKGTHPWHAFAGGELGVDGRAAGYAGFAAATWQLRAVVTGTTRTPSATSPTVTVRVT